MEKTKIERYNFANITESPNKKLVLIIYDIISNKKRNKMVKLLESYGSRVQKSAFEALLDSNQYREIIRSIENLINKEDNVRIYRLNSSNEVILLGACDSVYEEEVIII